MKRTRLIAWVVLAALLLSGIGSWWGMARARTSTRALLANAERERRELHAAMQKWHERFERAEKARREATDALAKARVMGSAVAGQQAAAPVRPRTMAEIISTSPNLEVIELERQRAAANQDYGRFFRQLGLSPEQQAKFRDLEVKSAATWMDLDAAIRQQGEAAQQLAAELHLKAKAEHEAAERSLLGLEGYRRLEEFNRTIPLYNSVVRGLAGASAIEGVPLSPDQGERLLAATVGATRGTTSRGDLEPRTIDWDALDAQAQQILTAQQFALFKNVQPPSGFRGRWEHQLDVAIQRALDAERAAKK